MKNLKVGIVGTGRIGSTLAKHLVKAGMKIDLLNSEGPESLQGLLKELGPLATAGTPDSIGKSDVVILSVDWEHLPGAIKRLPSLKDKIVIDPSNPIIPPGYSFADLHGKTSSEIVSAMLPGARVVKTFNTLPAAMLANDPHELGGQRVLFMSGDDQAAKATVHEMIDAMGFASIDLGGLIEGGKLQQIPGGAFPTLNLIKFDTKS